jgi:AmiR/NasT family two-component response regulator
MDVAALEERLRAAERRADNLEHGLMSNRRIGMAIGVLVTIRHLTDQQAFDELRGESMRRNVKLRDLAEQVIYTGTL